MRRILVCDVVARTCGALAFIACAAGPAHAQLVTPALPDSVAQRLVEFYNRETTTRFTGSARIGAGTVVRGDVAALAGTLIIEGQVDGNVVVINGDLELHAGGRVGGSAVVAGGDARIDSTAIVAGGVRVYREPLRYRERAEGIEHVPFTDEPGIAAGHDFAFGRTDLLIASRGAYNRVEGLPIAVGPRVRLGGTYPISARAFLIGRTAVSSELDPDRFGFEVGAEQLVVPAAGLTLGARLYSHAEPIETTGLTERESALATFVLHQDFRDYYEREGWSAFARMRPPGTAYTIGLEYRDEEHTRLATADPFTILENDEPWRPQPSVAEGALRSLVATVEYDTRNEARDPSAGWWLRAELEQGLGGSIENSGAVDPELLVLRRRTGRTNFITASVDVRRYARISPYARIGLRVLAAGSLDGSALPPQKQHALGGEGTLAGYRLFEFDCGARSITFELDGDLFHPYYGCDQVLLVQLEYQAGFPFARRLTRSIGLGAAVGNAVRWVAFFDAGRAWNEPGARDGRLGGNDDFSADAGLGLRLGGVGIYWAMPLSGHGQGFNFFVRIGPRI